MPRLDLFLLGSPRIERAGRSVVVDTRKAIALIAYLAMTRQSHSRDTLAALLWPESDQPHARAALRCTLSKLNKALAGTWLQIDRESIGLHSAAELWLDVEEFSASLAACRQHDHAAHEVCAGCLPLLSRAVELYSADFMAGFSLRDSPSFDDWQFFQADSLRHSFADALERLVACHVMRGDFAPAIAYARRWLEIDRLHEPAHRQLMQLYAWSGQRTAALHQYRQCVQTLEQELGVAPLEATTRLYHAIKENQVPPPLRRDTASVTTKASTLSAAGRPSANEASDPTETPAPDAVYTPSDSSYPLVERAHARKTLDEAYAAIRGDGRVMIVEGEAGIGKTRLVEEFLAALQKKGASIAIARCYEGEERLAYEPVAACLRAAIATRESPCWLEGLAPSWLSEATRLLPELALLRPGLPVAEPLDNPGARSRFFEGLRQVLLAACQSEPGSAPGVLFIDDLHWMDSASLEFLAYLVRRLRGYPLCLVLAWRKQHPANDQRLQYLLSEAQRAGQATLLSLTRLSRAAVAELAQAALAGTGPLPANADFVERLYRETEGLPLFLVEYLAALAKGTLTIENANWSLPGGARDLLHSRLEEVSETAGQVLSTAAVIGRSFDFDTLREVSGRGEEEAVAALEELVARGLITEMQGRAGEAVTYDFSHEKLRSLVYEKTSLARRRLLHRRIAETLVSHMRGREESYLPAARRSEREQTAGRVEYGALLPARNISPLVGQIAYHYQMAGNDSAAADYFKLAGERARSLYANAEALEQFRTTHALGYPHAALLHEAIGDLHTLLGEYSSALASYEAAAASGSAQDLARLEHKLGAVYARRGDWDLAESHFEAALTTDREQSAPGERARILADQSLAAYYRGQVERALDLASCALELAVAAEDVPAQAQAHNMLGILAGSCQDLERARNHLEQSLALTEGLDDPGIRAAALNNLALVYSARGEYERAIELAQAALTFVTSRGDRHREAALHNNLADLLHSVGRSAEAMAHLKQAVSIYAEIGVEAGAIRPEIWKLAEW